jgi:CRISPR-associated protein Cmr6
MESEKGKIIIRKSKKGKLIFEVEIGAKKPMTIPNFYEIKDETLNNKECLVFREKGQIKKITIDEKELPKRYNQPKKKFHNNKKNQSYKIKDSFDITKTKIPKDTREALKDFKNIDNFHLKLNKYARYDISDIKKQNEKKFLFFRNKAKDLEDIEIKPNFGDFDFEKNIEKQEKVVNSLFSGNYLKKDFTIDYRLVIGSEQSIYETSIRLHHIYGIPYIPSSAIKGVLRSYTILECFSEELKKYNEDKYQKFEEEVLFTKDEDGNYKHKWFIDIFGSQEQEGEIIFFDSFSKDVKIQKDIMTSHYGDYYDKKKKVAPTDTQSPNPIPFLTVVGEFIFFIASKKNSIEKYKIRDKSIKEWLKEALTNHGIGAKTAVGYGYFN